MLCRSRQPVHFVVCSCGNHGCFISRKRRGKELHTRNEVNYYLLLYLLTGEINYKEVDRTLKEMDRVKFSDTFRACLFSEALP